MSPTKRIILNVIATYGRSLYAIILGLLVGRWAYLALGSVDYGLMGLVGGLAAFITFFNSILATSVSRFYAVSVGSAQIECSSEAGLVECRKWFNTAVFVHLAVPALLMVVGYPIGVWVVKNFLTIPPERIESCVWVLRFVCISCFIGMATVPFVAMYTAKQYIAELTIYSAASATLNVFFLYFMVTHPGDWLVKYSAWTCFIQSLPQIVILWRALVVFDECVFKVKYMLDFMRLRQLFCFAWWRMFGTLGWLLQNQGISILINKYFGPVYNASMTVTSTINGHANSLTNALIGAFSPAITQSYGAKKFDVMKSMSYRSDKFGLILSLVFFIPLSLEIREVLHLWLKTPPPAAVGISLIAMLGIVAHNASIGFSSAISATGRIAWPQTVMGGIYMLVLPVAWMVCHFRFSIYYVVAVAAVALALNTVVRAFFAWRLLKMSIERWLFGIILPVSIVILVSGMAGCLPMYFIKPSLWRVVLTTLCVESMFLPLAWFWVLDDVERRFLTIRLTSVVGRMNVRV